MPTTATAATAKHDHCDQEGPIPSPQGKPPIDSPEEAVKYDGYRMMVIRDGDRVRQISRGGVDYARRFPWIVEAARKRQQRQFIFDGEAVLLAFHGISEFDGLHSGKYDNEVRLYAFDILALDGDDLRELPLSIRKQKLSRLLFRGLAASSITLALGKHLGASTLSRR